MEATSATTYERVFDAVVMIVADVFMCEESEILSTEVSKHHVTEARFAAFALMDELEIPIKRIGLMFKRDRVGIRYGIDVCQSRINEKPYYAESYRTCGRLLKRVIA